MLLHHSRLILPKMGRAALCVMVVLTGCQRPLPPENYVRPQGGIPLTVEQALPDDVSTFHVLMRGDCYFYTRGATIIPIATNPAPDTGVDCAT